MVGITRYDNDETAGYTTANVPLILAVRHYESRGWIPVVHTDTRVRMVNGTAYQLVLEEVFA